MESRNGENTKETKFCRPEKIGEKTNHDFDQETSVPRKIKLNYAEKTTLFQAATADAEISRISETKRRGHEKLMQSSGNFVMRHPQLRKT